MKTTYRTTRATTVEVKRGPGRPRKASAAPSPESVAKKPRFEIVGPKGSDLVLIESTPLPLAQAVKLMAIFELVLA